MKHSAMMFDEVNRMARMMKFQNFVSLGYICPTAASMSKYGLRSCSGPFDWLITKNLCAVLQSIENEFEDFLKIENIEHFSEKYFEFFIARDNVAGFKENPKHFIDRNGDFVFLHEKFSYVTEFEKIQALYLKKIESFLRNITYPTCFIRLVTDEKEIEYIKENVEYINRVIKKGNEHNEIVFVGVVKRTFANDLPFRYYEIGRNIESLRNMFDNQMEFLCFCADNFDSVTMMKNIMFDQDKEEKKNWIIKQRYELLIKILNMDLSNVLLPQEIIIYGAGNVGKQFYLQIKEKCAVVAFCDVVKKGTWIEEIPVLDLKEIEWEKNTTIIVTATYDFKNICDEIKKYDDKAVVISLEEILR